ncbi:MAG: hypothetical protein ABSA08_02890 [Acidimicrobiales bacterium]
MELIEIVRQAKARREASVSRISELSDLLDHEQDEMNEIDEMFDGLRIAARQFGDKEALAEIERTVTAAMPIDWAHLARTDAVLAVLNEVGTPMSPDQIASALTNKGREGDSAKYVSAALSGLRQAGRVENVGHALWQVASQRGMGAIFKYGVMTTSDRVRDVAAQILG